MPGSVGDPEQAPRGAELPPAAVGRPSAPVRGSSGHSSGGSVVTSLAQPSTSPPHVVSQLQPPAVQPSESSSSVSTKASAPSTRSASLIQSIIHPTAAASSLTHSTTSPPKMTSPGSSSMHAGQPEKLPSKPQQLLNKLKLGRKTSHVTAAARELSTIASPPPQQHAASVVSPPSGAAADRGSVPSPNPSATTRHMSTLTLVPPPPLSFKLHPRTGDSEPDFEELSPQSSVPTNPLAPLLTPFRMMKPLMPAVASRAVAGIKRPWQRRAAAAAPSLLDPDGGPVGSFNDCVPPMGYLWVWMGSFRRWQRRFIVASEAPGVLLIYKGMNMKGKVLSISLRNVDIHEDASDPRQLKIITPTGYIFLRASLPEERAQWMACLRESVRLYRANQGLVEKLKDKGLLPTPEDGSGSRPLNTIAGVLALPEATEMDVEQRRRIRVRLAEKLAEISPFQREVERHLGLLSSQLLGVVTGLNVRLPSLTPSNSMMRATSFHTATSPGAVRVGGPTPAMRPGVPAPAPMADASPPRSPLSNAQPRAPAGPAAAPGLQPTTRPPAPPAADGPAPVSSSFEDPSARAVELLQDQNTSAPQGVSETGNGSLSYQNAGGPPSQIFSDPGVVLGAAAAAPPKPLVADLGGSLPNLTLLNQPSLNQGSQDSAGPVTPSLTPAASAAGIRQGLDPQRHRLAQTDVGSRSRGGADAGPGPGAGGALGVDLGLLDKSLSFSAIKSHMRPVPQKTQNLQQAFGQLLEATRYALHSQAARIAELETENAAFKGAMQVLKHQQAKAWRVRGNGSFTAASHAASGAGAAPQAHIRGMMHGQLTEGSDTMNDDEDGDSDGDNDLASVMTADEDAFDVVEAFDDGVDYSILDNPDDVPVANQDGERSLSLNKLGAGVSDGDLETSATVLNALEVVRQVEYVERLGDNQRITKALATHEPPDSAPMDGVTEKEDESDTSEEEEEAGGENQDTTQAMVRGRSKLPAPRPLGKGFSIWSLLKNMIGKDLTRLTMPATINEPTSTIQRLAESLEYRAMLDRAAAETVSVDRLMMVAVWTATCYASQALRDGKPFNPLLGETYEWQSHDGDARYVCEQVSHHPPVLAYVADSAKGGWELQGELETKSKFWGKSAEVLLWGCEALKLTKWGEEYRWNRANICVQDVILGNYWIEVYGKVRVESSTGDVAHLNLKPCRRRMADRGKLEGTVSDANGNQVWILSGSTADQIFAQLTPAAAKARGLPAPPPPQLIWTKAPYPPDAAEQYWFSRFALTLNDPADRIVPYLPPTDSRFRPDQRALEVGEWNKATTEKLRLEEKQRQVRRERGKQGITYAPAWFKQVDPTTLTHLPDQPGFAWSFTGDYWKHRAAKDWSPCPDLYSMDTHVLAPKVGAQPPSP